MMLRMILAMASLLALLSACPAAARPWTWDGTKQIVLHSRSGMAIPIGSVSFTPDGDRIAVAVKMDPARLKVFFLSMRDFRCVEGEEVQCHVAYPYANRGSITKTDFRWLEHALLFMIKSPGEFGAKLENGIYYPLVLTPEGLVGRPQGIDLNLIAGPPDDLSIAPYADVERHDEPDGQRWISSLTIEEMP